MTRIMQAFMLDKLRTVGLKNLWHKPVMDKDGNRIGRVDDILIDQDRWRIHGILVGRGLLSSDYLIGRHYVDRIEEDAVHLSIVPVDELLHKKVFDSGGLYIGRVTGVEKIGNTNEVAALHVGTESALQSVPMMTPMAGSYAAAPVEHTERRISADDVERVNDHIILSKIYTEAD